MADERDDIRARTDIVELVGQTVALKKAGKAWKGLCPFHPDKHPSFDVNPVTQRYTCWSCGEKGDIFDWVMKTQNVEFAEAIQILAQRAGVELQRRKPEDRSRKLAQQTAMQIAADFFREALRRSAEATSYCDRRGLDEAVRNEWELGYAPNAGDALAAHLQKQGCSLQEAKSLFLVDQDPGGGFFDKFRGRLMFPIRDGGGDLVAFGGRLLGDGHPKYINSGDTPIYRKSRVLYGLNRAKESLAQTKRAVLVEGFLDVIACHRAGVRSAVASLGTAMGEDQAKLLKRWCDEVVILYDSDGAGQKAADRAVEILRAEHLRVRVALMPEGQDPDTLLRDSGPQAVADAVEQGISPLAYRLRAIESRLRPTEDEFWTETVAVLAGAQTPLELDEHLERLAAMYPGTKDRLRAQKEIRNWVGRVKRAKVGKSAGHSALIAQGPPKVELQSGEATLLRGVLDQELRPVAWAALCEADLLVTPVVIDLAAEMRSQFGDAGPQGPPSAWLPRVESERLLGALLSAERADHERLTPQYLEDAIAWLRRKRDARTLQDLKGGPLDPNALVDLQARLRSLKPDPRVDSGE